MRKDAEGSGHSLKIRDLLRDREKPRNFSQDGRSSGQELKPGHYEYKTGTAIVARVALKCEAVGCTRTFGSGWAQMAETCQRDS
jgi:hypothetical protein